MPARAPPFDASAATKLAALGERIRERRKTLKVSAVDAAEAAGMSRVTLQRIECAAMKIVPARSGNGVDGGPAVAAELRAVGIGLNGELLNRVRIWERERSVEIRILVFRAVQRVHIGSADASVHCIARGAGTLIQRSRAHRAWHQDLQLQNVAAVEWQFRDPDAINRLADCRGGGFHQGSGRRDRNLFTQLAHLEGDRYGDLRIYLEVDPGLPRSLEAAHFHLGDVTIARNLRSDQDSLFVGNTGADVNPGSFVSQGDRRSGNHRAGLVLYGHRDGAGVQLRQEHTAAQGEEYAESFQCHGPPSSVQKHITSGGRVCYQATCPQIGGVMNVWCRIPGQSRHFRLWRVNPA